MKNNFALPLALAALAVGASSSGVLAGDLNPPTGAIEPTMKTLEEVEPRTAINPVNTPGDAEAVYVIDTPGSYYLIGNLKGVAGKHGIKITASHVTVDLMGFRLSGVAGSLDGLNVPDNAADNIEVHSGTAENWGNDGIDLRFSTDQGVVRDVRVIDCLGTGIRVGADGLVKNCVVRGSPFGIQTSLSCRVIECDVSLCSLGINANAYSIVENCVAHDNTSVGINMSGSGRVHGCTVMRNDTNGIQSYSYAIITDNAISENGGDGINVNNGCLIKGNMIQGNAAGVHVASGRCRVESNHCAGNDIGIRIIGTQNTIIGNTCTNSTANNFQIAANNRFGRIVNLTTGSTSAVTGNSAASSIGTEDPWANFAQ